MGTLAASRAAIGSFSSLLVCLAAYNRSKDDGHLLGLLWFDEALPRANTPDQHFFFSFLNSTAFLLKVLVGFVAKVYWLIIVDNKVLRPLDLLLLKVLLRKNLISTSCAGTVTLLKKAENTKRLR